MGARVVGYLDWNGEQLDRLLDAEHASLVEAIVRNVRAAGWETITERTFAIAGERGSVDVLAWHATARALLVVEVKSVIADAQETLARLDRKRRLAGQLAPVEWRPDTVGTLLVVGETRTNRRRIAGLEATFGAAFPHRGVAVRSFLRAPAGQTLRGLVFLSPSTVTTARHRVRRP